jgi:TetR/AcrR family transcriptional repressor of mexCD-oprJ operon
VAALRWITAEVEHRLDEVDPAIPAADALDQLVATSWWVLGHFAGLRAAARTEIGPPAADTREEPLDRIRAILVRGRAEGAFRDDQDLGWQSECFYAILRVGASRIDEDGLPRPTVAFEMVRTIRALLEAAPAASAAAVSSHRLR